MKIKRIEHVAVVVKDMAKTGKMLEDIFGLKLEYEEQIKSTKLGMFPVGETYIELLQAAANAVDDVLRRSRCFRH